MTKLHAMVGIVLISVLSCTDKKEERHAWKPVQVTVTAYNSVPSQTQGNPFITAWGDTLNPKVKSIAVSRNLIDSGLTHNAMVRIGTLKDTFYVKDKMHRRWKNRIDIYMGQDVEKAKEWGKKKIPIYFAVLKDSVALEKDTN